MTKTKLKEILESKGISRNDLMEMTGLSDIVINGYIDGKREPSVSSLLKISKAINVSLDDILGNSIEREETASEFKRRLLDHCKKQSSLKGQVKFMFKTNQIFTNIIPRMIYEVWDKR